MEGPLQVGVMGQRLGVEQSLLSHHLRTLREAGMIRAQRKGKTRLYRLSGKPVGVGARNTLDLGCCHLSFGLDRD